MRNEFHKNLRKIENIKKKLECLKKEIKAIKTKQLSYYTRLLSEGKDGRQEGLIWIIKTLWLLGFNVSLSWMPRFLDQKAVQFLFKVNW